MPTRIGFSNCGVLLLGIALAGGWASWEKTCPRDIWTLDEPVRIITEFDPQKPLDISFRLCNTAHEPLRILGASAC
jgi:hypothetical protein